MIGDVHCPDFSVVVVMLLVPIIYQGVILLLDHILTVTFIAYVM